MAITLIELSKDLEDFANDLTGKEQGILMLKLGSSALGLIKQRVQEQGQNAEGDQFQAYSTKPMLASRKGMTIKAYKKVASSKSKRKELSWVTIGGHKLFELSGGYKQFRDLHDRQTGFVDFTFNGNLFGNAKIKGDVQIISDNSELASGIVTIAPTRELEKKKLAGLTKLKGEILELSKSEEVQLIGYYQEWVIDLLHKSGL